MSWFFAVLIVLAIGAAVVVASGRGGSLAPEYDDRPDVSLPDGRPLTGDDLRGIRFSTVVRGYRASEVDALLERVALELDRRADGPSGTAD
ncbi:MAG TPA: DivIVA domain-containing protein [Marmoricola sp.]|jgi:DivIVA domain-containing protein